VFRSRTLAAPRGQETRPTSDRVREALFSMLASDGVFASDPGPRVLDLFAGSGALGLEAVSRGARAVVMVENARPAIASIRENVRALAIEDQVTLIAMRVDRALDDLAGQAPFDLVLIDPPYVEVRSKGFGELLAKAARLLAASGILVLEHAASDEPSPPAGLVLDRRRRHGDTALSLFRSAGSDTDA
jgi:16S rRNA (guanine966-N2)-methyltransferase